MTREPGRPLVTTNQAFIGSAFLALVLLGYQVWFFCGLFTGAALIFGYIILARKWSLDVIRQKVWYPIEYVLAHRLLAGTRLGAWVCRNWGI